MALAFCLGENLKPMAQKKKKKKHMIMQSLNNES
jgi:hypothetical protein